MGQDFNVGGNMDAVLKQQQNTHQSMLDAVDKFNKTREEMSTLQQQTGAILSEYGVDEKGKPDDTAPKYVHDLFKNVNKEGGIANLSRTQLVAGLKAYETGTQVESQRQNLALNAQNQALNVQKLRQATLTNDLTEMQMQAALKQEKENQRIRDAYNNKDVKSQIDKIATEGSRTVDKTTRQIKVKGETINYTGEEMSPLLDNLQSAKDSGDKKRIEDAYDSIGKLLHGKTSVGRETNTELLDQLDENGMVMSEDVKNPNYKPYVSARDVSNITEIKAGEAIPRPSIPVDYVKNLADTQLKKYLLAKQGTEENEQAKLELDVARAESKTGLKVIPVSRLSRSPDARGTPEQNKIEWNNPQSQSFQVKIDDIDKKLLSLKEDIILNSKPPASGGGNARGFTRAGGVSQDPKVREQVRANAALEIRKLEAEKKSLNKNIDDTEAKTVIGLARGIQKVDTTYSGGSAQASEDSWKPVIEKVQEKYKRTLDEQTNDEFNIMKNYFESTGGVPATFTKEAFYASKGIQRPMVVSAGGGYVYAQGPDGKGHFLEDKTGQSSQMSYVDQERLWKAGEFSKARNLNGLTVNGYQFKGEVRVGDIDQANKVKDGVFKTTRALSALDSLIDIADNKGMFEKLLPTEVSGIAQALANTVQAANRTEVGGSGAWSNQDQANIDKIIRDPSKGHNAIFTSQTVASLKAYRTRLEQSMVDSGSIYGFAFERTQGQGSMSSQVGQFRIQYATGLAKFGNPEQALEYAKQSLNFDANE